MDKRKTDLSLRLSTDVIRDKTTGLRSNESIYRDKPDWVAAVIALRNHKLKKCAKIIAKGVLDDDKQVLLMRTSCVFLIHTWRVLRVLSIN